MYIKEIFFRLKSLAWRSVNQQMYSLKDYILLVNTKGEVKHFRGCKSIDTFHEIGPQSSMITEIHEVDKYF